MAKAKDDKPSSVEMKPQPPTLRLEDKYLAEFLPDGLKKNVGDEVELSATFRVSRISSGKEFDGQKRDSVELELVSTDEKAEGGKETKDEDMKGKMRRMQGRTIGVMIS